MLDTDGYTVVRGVVGEERLAPLRALAQAVSGLDLDAPDTWAGVPAFPPAWGHQAQWDVRQDPRVHAVFADAYGQEDLWVSQDALGINVPGSPGLPIHWDIDPREDRPHRMLQGVLYVTDCTPGQGAFVCVPSLFGAVPGDDVTWGLDVTGHEVVEVLGSAGDLVLFDARLPHGRADNTADRPRIVQYVTMWPPGAWGETAASHQEIWRTGMAPEHFRRRPGWDVPQPWPPATLTPLGRSLLGL